MDRMIDFRREAASYQAISNTLLVAYAGHYPTPTCASTSASPDYVVAHFNFTGACERVGAKITQASSLWVQDRDGAKELAVEVRAEDENAEDQRLFAAYIDRLAARAKTMRFVPSTSRVPQYQDNETPALYP